MARMFEDGEKRCIILFGAPGSGKGTQAEKLLNRVHISTGTMLRRKGYDLSTAAFISDDVVNSIAVEGIESVPYDVVLDGYPRTVAQAEFIRDYLVGVGIRTTVIHLFVASDTLLVDRLLRRGQGRPDDNEPIILERLEKFKTETLPALRVLAGAFDLWLVDAAANEETVHKYVMQCLADAPSVLMQYQKVKGTK